MIECDNAHLSHSDYKLIEKLKDKGNLIIGELKKMLSYHIPKKYKVYIKEIDYNKNNQDDNKIVLDLIYIVQKYNKLLEKRLEIFYEKLEENNYFSKGYKGYQEFNSDFCGKEANSSNQLMGNLLTKYEKKHIIFQSKFLQKKEQINLRVFEEDDYFE